MKNSPFRVLVVDDDIDTAESLATIVQLLGYDAKFLTGGDLLADARAFHPDVRIVDLAMPGITGCDLASLMQHDDQLRGTEIVAVSGYQDKMHRDNALECGMRWYFVKPVDPDAIAKTLERIAAKRSDSANAVHSNQPVEIFVGDLVASLPARRRQSDRIVVVE